MMLYLLPSFGHFIVIDQLRDGHSRWRMHEPGSQSSGPDVYRDAVLRIHGDDARSLDNFT